METDSVSSNFMGMQKGLIYLFLTIFLTGTVYGNRWEIVSSDHETLVLDIEFIVQFQIDLEPEHITIGLPTDNYPQVESIFSVERPFNFTPVETPFIGVEWVGMQQIHSLNTATIRISPFAGNQQYYSSVRVTLRFDDAEFNPANNLSKHQKDFLSYSVANWETAQSWISESPRQHRTTFSESEHLIIGPTIFESASQPLIDHRVNSQYVRLDSIYTQFGDGSPSPAAIREYLMWAYTNWSSPPVFVLLMGDIEWVGTLYGHNYNGEYAADDYFVTPYTGSRPVAAIGRYPAHTSDDVDTFVAKLIEHETNPEFGPWRSRITLVADDAARPEPNIGDVNTGKSHTRYSEQVAERIPDQIEIKKIYMMDYPEVSDASAYGVVKPDATEALFAALEEGTAVLNYIGHGEPAKLAQEELLSKNRGDIHSIQTGMKLPIWIGGTCSWGYFDDPNYDAMSEDIIRLPGNGASAVITTSRNIGIPSNGLLVRNIVAGMFSDGQTADAAIGNVLQSVKPGTDAGRLFHLFGDPAMPLPFPKGIASLDSISSDTLITLSPTQFFGTQPFEQASGTGYVNLKEGTRFVTRHYIFLGNEEELSYYLPGASLFRGQFSFSGDQFSGELIVPKDISNLDTTGYLRTYILTENGEEALAVNSTVTFSGNGSVIDTEGPMVQFETSEGRILQTGDHFFKEEGLILRLSDINGINLTEEIGHEILLTDLSTGHETDVTERFVYDIDEITTGTIFVPLDEFDSELYIQVRAWDNANNLTEKEISLTQSDTDRLQLFQVYNFPNPFSDGTQFTFEITSPADVKIDIYTLGGKRIHSIDETYFPEAGYYTIPWNGTDHYGETIANGVYLYRLKATNSNHSVSIIEKLAKFR